MVDWTAHYDTIYDALGVPAELVLGTDGEFGLTVIDKSAPLSTRTNTRIDDLIVIYSAKAMAAVRMTELAGHSLSREELADAMITFNGATWRIKATEPFPSPLGIDHGELYLMLVDDG